MSLVFAQASSTTVSLFESDDSVSGEPFCQSSESTSATFLGSTADTRMSLPPTTPPANESEDTVFTPGVSAAARPAPGLIGEKPSVFWRTMSPWKLRSIALPTEALIPAANVVTNTTTARPIISAPAVTAVRPGLRTVFSRASRPVRPRSFSSGQPQSEASGRTSRGLNIETPKSVATAPPPTSAAAVFASSVAPNSPAQVMPMPIANSSSANAVKIRPRVRLSGSSASRSAAIGDTRVARTAGTSAEASVTPTPTTSATTIVRVSITVPVFGRSIPKLLKIPFRAAAKPIPAGTPSPAPRMPRKSASRIVPPRIWRRLAPSVRSMPNSRIRWATVIEKMLKIRKLPTSSATPPNTSSTTRKNERSSLMSCAWRAAACVPVSTTSRGGSTWSMRVRSSRGDTPGAALTEIPSSSPRLSVIACASGSVSWAVPDPPPEVSPSRWRPTIRYGLHARLAGDPQRVADLEALAVGGRVVDRRLGGGARRAAVGVGERLEGLGRHGADELGREAVRRAGRPSRRRSGRARRCRPPPARRPARCRTRSR